MPNNLPAIGVPFVPSTMEQIRDMLLTDIRFEMLKTSGVEPAVSEGSDNWAWATAHASIAMLQFSNIELSRDAITPLNATGQDLENWRIALGLPEVKPSSAAGKIVLTVTGVASVLDGEPIVLANGLRAQVVSNWLGVTNLSEVDAIAIDVGSRTNQPGGAKVRFATAPTNVSQDATISKTFPFTGGFDAESDNRKRTRVLNAIANKLAAGSWPQIRGLVLDNHGGIQDCFVYPALGGPASVKVVPVVDYDTDNGIYSRAVNAATLASIRNTVYSNMPDSVEFVIEASANQTLDLALQVTVPNSSLDGGDGSGWLDSRPFPALQTGETRVFVNGFSTTTGISVSSLDPLGPIANLTHVAWWSPVDRKFRAFLVTAVSGAAGGWLISVEQPMVADDGTPVAPGDFICPAAVHSDAYGKSWISVMRKIGIGENTADAGRLPRAQRQPSTADESPANVSFKTLKAFQQGNDEISDISVVYSSALSPTIPPLASSPPAVLVPRHFAIYPF